MWTKFHLKNYKGYEDSGEQELRPLTLLIGPNGGGKSALLRFWMVLKQTVESSDTYTTLITSGEPEKAGYVDIGLYKEFVFKGDGKRNVEATLSWEPHPMRQEDLMDLSPLFLDFPLYFTFPLSLTFQLSYRSSGKQIVVNKVNYTENDASPLIALSRQGKGTYQPISPAIKPSELSPTKYYEPQKFYRLPPALLASVAPNLEDLWRRCVVSFETQVLDTFYLGPLREYPRRYYEATGERPIDLGNKGQKIGTVLYNEAKLVEQTNRWLQKLDIAQSFSLSRIAKGNLFHLNIQGKDQSHHVNLADYGFGVSQILPVIVESLYTPLGATLLIEQPEIHLNAHQQLELPNLFVDLIHKDWKQFIIETHSEYFLKRFATLVARGELDPKEIIIFYCHSDGSGSHLTPITLDKLGRASWWPADFLSEGFEGTAQHIEAMENLGDSE